MITELKPTNLIAVEVPKYASDFFLIKPANYFHINYELPEYHSGVALFYNDFGGKCNYPTKIKILGEVTKDKIGFDVEPYAEKEMNGFYKNYSWDGSGRYYGYLTPYDSFRSLLAINGLYFENPIKVSGKHIVGTITKLAQDWQSFEDKLIKGKLLILEKI